MYYCFYVVLIVKSVVDFFFVFNIVIFVYANFQSIIRQFFVLSDWLSKLVFNIIRSILF